MILSRTIKNYNKKLLSRFC